MRQYIGTHTEALRNYLKDEFGGLQECCGVMAPPAGTIVDIVEPLQTCHKIGEGLDYKLLRGKADGVFLSDEFVSKGFHPRGKPTGYSTSENKCIPICTLIVGELIHDVSSHSMKAMIMSKNELILFEAGYGSQICIDWRGTVKHIPTTK